MSTNTNRTTGPSFEDIDQGDTITTDLPPRCHESEMQDRTGFYDHLASSVAEQARADMDAGLIGRWQCWTCDCEIYTDANGVVTEPSDGACGDHCTC